MHSQTDGQASRFYIIMIALIAAVGGFLFGYDLTIISGAILNLRDSFNMTTGAESFAMASAMIGCLLGPPIGSVMADSKFGRKWSLMFAAGLFLVSAIGTALPQTQVQFNIFRIVGGIGVGLASVVSPMYIAEISPPHIRGALVSLNQLMIVVGAFIASLVSWLLIKYLPPETSWRWMFGTECIPIAALMVGLFFVPRSPRWLVQQKRFDEAEGILTLVDGRTNAKREMDEIRSQLNQEEGTWAELIGPGIRMALLIAVALTFFQQYTGVSPSTFYMPTIFEMVGFEKDDAIKQLVYANIFNIVMTMCAILVLDRLGRRPILLYGIVGMGVGLILWGCAFHFGAPGYIILITFLIAFGAYLVSLAPLGWLIMSEVFPTKLRAKGMAVASFCVWIAAFTSVYGLKFFLVWTEEKFGSPGPAFWAFSIVCFLAWYFCYKLVPETKGRTLEQISDSFLHGKSRETDSH